ncbi:Sodium-coupled monocarboxylate transporter 1 [Armadillidium nasatum]|uniref:Sodium-coupled monocarboxylate transporter 1 n=1 Tax=Armadillidium nasatum TaxID=96803 RepID=A0A5N5T4G4_9CRUS|nr:Sodium-coupled monocarboxylate transporter 1 [Armadillidium nasatum]
MNETNSVSEVQAALISRFTYIDYGVFALMLLLSAAIGIFYGCFGNKMNDTKEFLMAGKSMTTFPVAMSLIASFMSAITLLGTPSEVYSNGFVYWLIGFSYPLVMPAAAYLYLPVFWDLQVTSAYEYLEVRFNRYVRMLGSLIFIIQMCLYMAIVVYAPALALSQVTGINVYLSVSLICFVCMFYTTLGGMKAVLWTDALQVGIMYLVMVFIIIKGAVDQGGFLTVWEAGTRGNRTSVIDWDPNPTARHTFWTLLIGGYFTWITIYGVNQAQVQRYMCVQERSMAIKALWINMIGLFFLMIICAFGGLVIYAKYETCDPLKSKLVSTPDQLLPLFVMDTLGEWKGIPGLFVAGIFSGALSTVSSGMNSLAAITLEDFIRGVWFPDMSESTATRTSKILSLFFGLLTFALAALSIFGMVGGPLVWCLQPWHGAFIGTLFGLGFTFWIGVGFQVAKFQKKIPSTKLPVNMYGCEAANISFIETVPTIPILENDYEDSVLLSFYQVSYLWYSAIGVFSVIIIGMLVSLVTGLQDVRKLNPKALSPLIHWIKPILPEGDLIGTEFDGEEEKGLKSEKQQASVGNLNFGFTDNSVAVKKNGHIENEEQSSRL